MHPISTTSPSPFRPALKAALLYTPFLFIVPLIYEFGSGDAVARGYTTWFRPFHDLLMFHTMHLIFPFMLIVLQKDLRALIFDRNKKYTLPIAAGTVAVFCSWIGLLAVNQYWTWSLMINALVMTILPAVHCVNQSFGMLFIYNKAAPSEKFEALVRFERRATAHVLFSAVAANLCNIGLHQWAAHSAGFVQARTFFVVYSFFWAARVVFVNLRAKDVALEKKIFSFRYLFFPLTAVSTSALLCVGAFHGYEYLAIFDKSLNRRPTHSRALLLTVVGGGGVIIAALALYALYWVPQISPGGQTHWTYTVASQFLSGLAIAHYYIDSQLYKFRNADFKKLYGTTFFEPWSSAGDRTVAGRSSHEPASSAKAV